MKYNKIIKIIYITVCLVLLLITTGCIAISDGGSDDVSSDTPIEEPSNNSTETETVMSEGSPKDQRNLTTQEQEYLDSTQWFGKIVALNFDEHTHTKFHDFQGFPDNSIGLAIQTDGEAPLERSIMDGAELVASMTYLHTIPNPSLVKNASIDPVHQPDMVEIELYGPNSSLLGRYNVDPALAWDYRSGNVTAETFSQSVTDSYKVVKTYDKRGNRSPKYYLNNSELDVWRDAYAEELLASDNLYENPYPTSGLRANSSQFEVLHEFDFNSDKYGQNLRGAKRTAWGSYLRAHMRTFARTPKRVNLYIHRPPGNRDYVAHMERKNVMKAVRRLGAGDEWKDVQRNYQNNDSSRFLEGDESPFEGF